MFPSIENLNKEKNKRKEEVQGDLFTIANAVKSRGGYSDPYELNVEQEVRSLDCFCAYFCVCDFDNVCDCDCVFVCVCHSESKCDFVCDCESDFDIVFDCLFDSEC